MKKEQELTVIVTNPGALLNNDRVWQGLAKLALEIAYDKGYLPLKQEPCQNRKSDVCP